MDMKKVMLDLTAESIHAELISRHLDICFKALEVEDEVKIKEAKSWLLWARGHHNLKLVSAVVPAGILPKGCSAILHDVKVSSRGPDDAIYDKHKEIRDKVARGNCIAELHTNTASTPETRCVTYALKKFTGGLGDDDDRDRGDNSTWKRYFLKPLEEAETVICTRKANGEAAHVGARRIQGQIFICAGSKNVHMLFRNKEDLHKYEGDRYRIAREVCETVLDFMQTLNQEQKNRLLEFLSQTELTGVFEILNPSHQHVENFSHMDSAELKFITWTSCDLDPSPDQQLCGLPPHVSIEIARALGLSTVDYEVIPVSEVDTRMQKIRQGYRYEGEVLYFLDSDSSVIGLLKKKTIWYIVCRAIREKLRTAMRIIAKEDLDTTRHIKKISSRLREIKQWLGLDDESTEAWTNLGVGFLKWCLHQKERHQLDLSDIADLFPVTWAAYLKDTDQTDQINSQYNEPEADTK